MGRVVFSWKAPFFEAALEGSFAVATISINVTIIELGFPSPSLQPPNKESGFNISDKSCKRLRDSLESMVDMVDCTRLTLD